MFSDLYPSDLLRERVWIWVWIIWSSHGWFSFHHAMGAKDCYVADISLTAVRVEPCLRLNIYLWVARFSTHHWANKATDSQTYSAAHCSRLGSSKILMPICHPHSLLEWHLGVRIFKSSQMILISSHGWDSLPYRVASKLLRPKLVFFTTPIDEKIFLYLAKLL